LQGSGSVEGVSSSSENKSDLVTQCENLRDVVRKAEVNQISAFCHFIQGYLFTVESVEFDYQEINSWMQFRACS